VESERCRTRRTQPSFPHYQAKEQVKAEDETGGSFRQDSVGNPPFTKLVSLSLNPAPLESEESVEINFRPHAEIANHRALNRF
jgi:hypothetical protein